MDSSGFEQFAKDMAQKYDNLEVFKQYFVDINEYTKFNCPIHGLKKQIAQDLLDNGCNQCNSCIHERENCQLCKGLFSDFDEYKTLCQQVWGNNYSYLDKGDKVDVYCNRHSYFTVDKIDHLKGAHCPKCFSNINKPFLALLQAKFGFRYDYSQVVYVNEYTKVKLRGSKGFFEEAPYLL
jgi:tRNA U54 and U55 pseudouridine synthase Pus10